MAEEEEEDENKRIRPRERARGQKTYMLLLCSGWHMCLRPDNSRARQLAR